MPKRAADSGEPGTSTSGSGREESLDDFTALSNQSSLEDYGAPAAKKFNVEVKQEINDSVEQSGALVLNDRPQVKTERRDAEDDEETSQSPIPRLVDDDEEEDETDSIIDRTDIPPPSAKFVSCCKTANLPDDIVIGSWEMFFHAFHRVSLEGSEEAWQMAAIYYYLLSKNIKRHGKPSRLLVQPIPVSISTIIEAFDVSVMEILDKTVRFVEIIHSRKMRRYLDYIRRIQESLAISCVIFKNFVGAFCEMFVEVPNSSPNSPSSHELFTLFWTSYLVLKSRLATDDLVTNYLLVFSMLDHIYTEICSKKDGIVRHLDQKFVARLLDTDSTIIRLLCVRFGGSVLDTKHFHDHVYRKIDRTGLPTIWSFGEYRDSLLKTTIETYDEYLLHRGGIDERIFIPSAENFYTTLKKNGVIPANVLKTSKSGVEFKDAKLLHQIADKQCLEKLSLSKEKTGAERLSQSREHPRVPYVEYSLDIGTYPEDGSTVDTHTRLKRIIGNWELETSQLKQVCEQMSDNPMATLLLKCDVMTEKFEQRLTTEMGDNYDGTKVNAYHHFIRLELEKLFLVYIEKILVAETRKKVKEEVLLNVIRREEFLDSVFCFCVELTLFSNSYLRAFPWSANLCEIHPFQFHKIIDLMINHEKRLSREMVQHFNKIEENVIEYYAWKSDSPMWKMIIRCPLSHFQEFGENWVDKATAYSPMKLTPNKKTEELVDDLGRPIVPRGQVSRTLRIFLKRTFFTAARRLQELTDRISMGTRPKNQCWSLFDFLIRNDPLILMDRHLDQVLLCCTYVVMKINDSTISFNEIMGHYRRQAKDATFVYRNVTVFSEQVDLENPQKVNTKETIQDRLDGPLKAKETVNLIKFYNIEFRDRIKYIIGQLDGAPEEELMSMPVPTSYGLMPVRVAIANNVTIQMLPKTSRGNTKQETAIANLEVSGVSLDMNPGHVTVPSQ